LLKNAFAAEFPSKGLFYGTHGLRTPRGLFDILYFSRCFPAQATLQAIKGRSHTLIRSFSVLNDLTKIVGPPLNRAGSSSLNRCVSWTWNSRYLIGFSSIYNHIWKIKCYLFQ